MKAKAYAKVNLFINVLDKRKDGYHELQMVNAKIDLYDDITIEETDCQGMVMIRSNDMFLSNQNNVVFDVAKYMIKAHAPEKGVNITIGKNIPFGAGLAGNSTDAACIIRLMDDLFDLHLSMQEMADIGVKFGADIPYCLYDGTAIVEGIGDKITPVEFPFGGQKLLLMHPKTYISTEKVFKKGDKSGFDNGDFEMIRKAIDTQDVELFISHMHNALQAITIGENEKIAKAYEEIKEKVGTDGVVMTGSGSTFVKVFPEENKTIEKVIDDFSDEIYVKAYKFL